MENPLTVLLVEDDQEECMAFVQVIDRADDIRLIGVTNNENKALEYVVDQLPDAVILDLELHCGIGNGIAFMEALKEKRMKVSPYILVTTHNISRMTHERVRQLGVDFIMVKSEEDYSAKTAVEFLRSLKKTIQNMKKRAQAKSLSADDSPFDIRKRQENRVAAEIDRIGISPKATGRKYIIDAIMLRIEDRPNQLKAIANKYAKTDASVERAMQNAINKVWNTIQSEDLSLHYTAHIHSEKGVPTVTEFVCHYANKIKAEY